MQQRLEDLTSYPAPLARGDPLVTHCALNLIGGAASVALLLGGH